MSNTRITASLLSILGLSLLLAGLMASPVQAMRVGAPAAQPSPRPPWYATMTPTPGGAAEPPSAPPLASLSPTPTVVPVLLPASGGQPLAGWLTGLGAGCLLLGLAIAALGVRRGRSGQAP